jgi:DNA-binding beta-propeller fold protein YncE
VGLAYDAAAGRLFIADVDAHLIRVVDFEARQIATFAGTAGQPGSVDGDRETARLSGPWAIDLASDGTLYVAEAESGALRAVDASGAVTTVVAPGTFEQPLGLAVDAANGRAFVADMAAPAVYTVSLDDGASEILVGQPGATGIRDGSADEALLSGPWGLAVVEGGLLIVDAENHLIRRFDFAQQRLDRWLGHPLRHGGLAPGSQVPWDEMTFERPRAVASDADTLWVVSQAALYGATAQ